MNSLTLSSQPWLSKSQKLSLFGGTLLEAYDNFLFIALLPLLAPLFFPDSSSFQTQIMGYTAFACSYLGRPFGSLVFGHIGDRYGRMNALSLSILLISFFTCTLAFLPSYPEAGLLATVLFVTARFFQGFCYGGETIGSTITFVETSQSNSVNKRAIYTSCSILMGGLVASGVGTLVNALPHPEFYWRYAFLAGAIMGLIGLYIRLNSYNHVKETLEEKAPLWSAIKEFRFKLFYPLLITGGVLVPFCIIFVYAPVVLKNKHGLSDAELSILRNTLMLFSLALLPIMGYIADRLHPRIMASYCVKGFFILAASWILISTLVSAFWGLIILLIGLCFLWTGFSGPSNVLVIRYFPPSIRYSALGLSLSYGILLFSLSPILLAYLDEMNFGTLSIAGVLILTGLISAFSGEKLMETSS